MTFFVKCPVTSPWIHSVGFGRDCVFTVLVLDIIQNFIAAIGFVTQHIALGYINMRQDLHCHCGIIDVSSRQLKIYGVAQSIYDSMNLRIKSTT